MNLTNSSAAAPAAQARTRLGEVPNRLPICVKTFTNELGTRKIEVFFQEKSKLLARVHFIANEILEASRDLNNFHGVPDAILTSQNIREIEAFFEPTILIYDETQQDRRDRVEVISKKNGREFDLAMGSIIIGDQIEQMMNRDNGKIQKALHEEEILNIERKINCLDSQIKENEGSCLVEDWKTQMEENKARIKELRVQMKLHRMLNSANDQNLLSGYQQGFACI